VEPGAVDGRLGLLVGAGGCDHLINQAILFAQALQEHCFGKARIHAEQSGCPRHQRVEGQVHMAFVAGQLEDVRHPGRHPLRRVVRHAQRLGNSVGRLEPDAGDVSLQAIRIGLDQRDRLGAVLLVDLGCQTR